MQTPQRLKLSDQVRRTASPINVAREASAAESIALHKRKVLKEQTRDVSRKSPSKMQESRLESHRQFLISSAEEYANFINSQKIGHRKKEEQTDDVKDRLNRALENLEDASNSEQKTLKNNITALNDAFGKNTDRVEREALKQVEKLKQELLTQIYQETVKFEDRLRAQVDKIAERVAPPSLRDAKGKAFGHERPESPTKSFLYRPVTTKKPTEVRHASAKPFTSLRAYKMAILNS